MKHAKKFAISICVTTLLYNNCGGFKGVSGVTDLASNGSSGTPGAQPTPLPQLGVDPHPNNYPPVMGTPGARNPETVTPVTSWPVKQAELPKIPSNFVVDDWINDSGGDTRPAHNGFDDVGAFRFICKPSHNLYDDPIVYPNQPGASHLHTFFGNTLTNNASTYSTLRQTGEGTCSGGPLNRSAYWHPALRIDDGDGNDLNDKIIMPDYAAVYYKMEPLQSTMFARGLRIIFGYNMSNPAASTGFNWVCSSPQGVIRGNNSNSSLKAIADTNLCVAGDDLYIQVGAPTCWNGQLDSADHRSHVKPMQDTNLGYGACPATHPYHFPAFSLSIHFTVGPQGAAEVAKMYLASDHMPGMNMDAGSTFHTDWFGAWDDDVANEWMLHADAGFGNCSGGDLCDGRGMKDPFQKTGLNGYSSLLNPANPRVVEPPVKP